MKKLIAIVSVLCALLPTDGSTQTGFDLSKKPVGDVVRSKAHNGQTSIRFMGRDGKFYRLEFERDASKGAPFEMVLWANRSGNTVKKQLRDATITYTPHDCHVTAGECRYTERHSRLWSRQMIWNATQKNGVWSYTLHHTKVSRTTLLEEGRLTVDRFGYEIDGDHTFYSNGKLVEKAWTRRIR